MASFFDRPMHFEEGPAFMQITPYNSAGEKETDNIIIKFAKDGVNTTITPHWRDRTADSSRLKIKKVLTTIDVVGSAVCQDMGPDMIGKIIGGTLIQDGTDSTKKRLELSTTTPFKLPHGAEVKIISKDKPDHAITAVKAEVFVSSLVLDKGMEKDMTWQIDFEGVMPNVGEVFLLFGSDSAIS